MERKNMFSLIRSNMLPIFLCLSYVLYHMSYDLIYWGDTNLTKPMLGEVFVLLVVAIGVFVYPIEKRAESNTKRPRKEACLMGLAFFTSVFVFLECISSIDVLAAVSTIVHCGSTFLSLTAFVISAYIFSLDIQPMKITLIQLMLFMVNTILVYHMTNRMIVAVLMLAAGTMYLMLYELLSHSFSIKNIALAGSISVIEMFLLALCTNHIDELVIHSGGHNYISNFITSPFTVDTSMLEKEMLIEYPFIAVNSELGIAYLVIMLAMAVLLIALLVVIIMKYRNKSAFKMGIAVAYLSAFIVITGYLLLTNLGLFPTCYYVFFRDIGAKFAFVILIRCVSDVNKKENSITK